MILSFINLGEVERCALNPFRQNCVTKNTRYFMQVKYHEIELTQVIGHKLNIYQARHKQDRTGINLPLK
jgi:hypothetical protein